jgi:hypothetical protein
LFCPTIAGFKPAYVTCDPTQCMSSIHPAERTEGCTVGRQHRDMRSNTMPLILRLFYENDLTVFTVNFGTALKACNVVTLCGVPTATIICHDKRYPELTRLPVLAGARLIFYIACELWHDDLPLPAPRSPPWSLDRLEAELGVRCAFSGRDLHSRMPLVPMPLLRLKRAGV